MQLGSQNTGRSNGSAWQSLLRLGLCLTICLVMCLEGATPSWAQSDEAVAVEESVKGGFATSLAYMLAIVVVALGVVVVCRTTVDDEESQESHRDYDDRFPGRY